MKIFINLTLAAILIIGIYLFLNKFLYVNNHLSMLPSPTATPMIVSETQKDVTNEEVIKILDDELKKYPEEFNIWLNRECVDYWTWDDYENNEFVVEIHDFHDDIKCVGDPQTHPLLALFRINMQTHQIYWYDIINDKLVPFEEFVKFPSP